MDRPFWGHKDMLLLGLYLGVALLNSPSNTLSALVHTLPDYRRSNTSKGVLVHPIHFTDETRERTCARPGPHSSQVTEPSLDLGSPHSVPRPLPTWRGCSAHHSDNLTSGPLPHLPASPQAGCWLHILSEGPGQCTLGKTKRRKEWKETKHWKRSVFPINWAFHR